MTSYDLVIAGAGSGKHRSRRHPGRLEDRHRRGRPLQPDLLDRGCIPSKMPVTADVASTVRDADRFGVTAELTGADWPAIKNRIHEAPASGTSYGAP